MCRKTSCSSCKKPTWAGCGMHVDMVGGLEPGALQRGRGGAQLCKAYLTPPRGKPAVRLLCPCCACRHWATFPRTSAATASLGLRRCRTRRAASGEPFTACRGARACLSSRQGAGSESAMLYPLVVCCRANDDCSKMQSPLLTHIASGHPPQVHCLVRAVVHVQPIISGREGCASDGRALGLGARPRRARTSLQAAALMMPRLSGRGDRAMCRQIAQ